MKEHWVWVGACHKVSCVFNNLSTHQKRRHGTHPRWGHSVVKIPWRRIAQVRGALWRESAVPQRGSYSSPPPAPISDCAPELTTHKHTETKGNTLITLSNRNHHEFYPLHSITMSKRWASVLQATKILFSLIKNRGQMCMTMRQTLMAAGLQVNSMLTDWSPPLFCPLIIRPMARETEMELRGLSHVYL